MICGGTSNGCVRSSRMSSPVQTASLANIPSLDSLTDEEREQMERMLQLGPNVPLVQIPTNSEARAHEQAAMWGFPWTSHGFTQRCCSDCRTVARLVGVARPGFARTDLMVPLA